MRRQRDIRQRKKQFSAYNLFLLENLLQDTIILYHLPNTRFNYIFVKTHRIAKNEKVWHIFFKIGHSKQSAKLFIFDTIEKCISTNAQKITIFYSKFSFFSGLNCFWRYRDENAILPPSLQSPLPGGAVCGHRAPSEPASAPSSRNAAAEPPLPSEPSHSNSPPFRQDPNVYTLIRPRRRR
jgi:hypothetical protein